MMIHEHEKPADEREGEVTVDELDGLNEVYRDIAEALGLETALVLFRMFRGTQVSFPNRLFSKEYVHLAVRREFNGKNARQLAKKYSYSERSVWRILKEKNETD